MDNDTFQIQVRNDNLAPLFLTRSVLVWPTSWGMIFDYNQFNGVKYYDVDYD